MSEDRPRFQEKLSLAAVERTSREFSELANAISGKVDSFLQWLNKLPGHIATEVSGPDPDREEGHFAIKIARNKNGWSLYFSSGRRDSFDDASDERWAPVETASLSEKCMAVSLLPALVQKMHQEQSDLVDRLREATSVLEDLPIAKPRKTGEGA